MAASFASQMSQRDAKAEEKLKAAVAAEKEAAAVAAKEAAAAARP